jgi:hypothetical protein
MIRTALYVLFFCFLHSAIYGQYSPRIASPRPGIANGAATVGRGVLQFQTGLQYENIDDYRDSVQNKYSNFSENIVIRIGVLEKLEISAVINHINSKQYLGNNLEPIYQNGINTSLLRSRLKINDNMAIQIGVETRIRGKDYQIDYFAPRFRVMYNTSLGNGINLLTNLGAVWNGISKEPNGFYAFRLSFPLDEKINLLTEVYGNFNPNKLNNHFDIGVGYFINNDFQIDLSGGWGRNYPYQSYFISTGASFRMITKNRIMDKRPTGEQ